MQYFDAWGGQFYLHHPFEADVTAQVQAANSFAEIYWEDKLMPYIGGNGEIDENISKSGKVLASDAVYRCPSDLSQRKPFIDPDTGMVDGVEHRTSFLMNSLLSHKTRRYGHWTLMRFVNEVGTSQFVGYSERNAAAFTPPSGEDPRQDDYDIWLGTANIKPWIADTRHATVANYLYLDGHAVSMRWAAAVIDMYPDKQVLTADGSYP
jgi:prepilin-type processing-associated H-X9-DG protein